MNFLCPLCKKNSAYIPKYGMSDSIICKCQGLTEVGRFTANGFVPHKNLNPINILGTFDKDGKLRINLQKNRSNPLTSSTISSGKKTLFSTKNFIVKILDSEKTIADAGKKYQNHFFSNPKLFKQVLKQYKVYEAVCPSDDTRNMMFIIVHPKLTIDFCKVFNKESDPRDRQEVSEELRHKKMISN